MSFPNSYSTVKIIHCTVASSLEKIWQMNIIFFDFILYYI